MRKIRTKVCTYYQLIMICEKMNDKMKSRKRIRLSLDCSLSRLQIISMTLSLAALSVKGNEVKYKNINK